ncbi:MAG: hypothetical protein JNL57_07350 [Bacteroidetes bacterium]|nr:hypothetical protein [Bacteroidota bacterium]
MKNLFFCLTLFSAAGISAQGHLPEKYGKVTRIITPVYHSAAPDSLTIWLPMGFNGSVPKEKLAGINIEEIQSVTLVYTQYRLSETFNQLELNAARTMELYKQLPGLKSGTGIQWYWTEQTGCTSASGCQGFFHGFVIHKKAPAEVYKAKTEVALLDYYISLYEGKPDTKVVDSLIKKGNLKMVKMCDTLMYMAQNPGNKLAKLRGLNSGFNTGIKKLLRKEIKEEGSVQLSLLLTKRGKWEWDEDASELPHKKRILQLLQENVKATPARYKNRKIPVKADMHIMQQGGKIRITCDQEPVIPDTVHMTTDEFLFHPVYNISCEYRDTSLKTYNTGWRTEAVVTKVLDRNTQWSNCLVVTDVTGSMSPYLAQFLQWHKLHLKITGGNHDFVFFNDGDNRPDNTKKTGEVGGIYYIKTGQYEDLNKKIKIAMANGGGGDGPENNIEAILEGLRKYPDCKEIIMIADNWATPRDLSLLKHVKIPVRLILCGASLGYNSAYLNMVRQNGGSIHTMEEDLYQLNTLAQNAEITLSGLKYKLQGDDFVPVK